MASVEKEGRGEMPLKHQIYRQDQHEVSTKKFNQLRNYLNALQCTYEGQKWNYQGLVFSGVS
jgi:hypothetical protein